MPVLRCEGGLRRFEFSDGKSHKFWEIEATDASVTTRWGRIGTNGQTKTKDLGTAAKASAEVAKQIKAKVKKGYAEVEVDDAQPSLDADAVAPVEAAVAEVDEAPAEPDAADGQQDVEPDVAPDVPTLPESDGFEIPKAWMSVLHPRRGGRYVPPVPDAGALWDALVELVPSVGGDPPSDWSLARAERILKAHPARHTWAENPVEHALVAAVAVTLGPQAAFALVLPSRLPNFSSAWGPAHLLQRPSMRWLRRWLTIVDDDTYAAARAAADTFDEVHADAMFAYLFPELGTWSTHQAQQHHPYFATCADSAEEVLEAGSIRWWTGPEGVLETLIVEHGDAAMPIIAQLLTQINDAEMNEHVVSVLKRAPSAAAFSVLTPFVDRRQVMTGLAAMAPSNPVGALSAGLRDAKMPDVLLRGWLTTYPAAWEQVRSTLPPAAKGRADRLLSALGTDLPQVALTDLPPLFSDPPWKRKVSRTRTPKVIQLEAVLPEPTVRLTDSERAAAQTLVEQTTEDLGGRVEPLWTDYQTPGRVLAMARAHPTSTFLIWQDALRWTNTVVEVMHAALIFDEAWAVGMISQTVAMTHAGMAYEGVIPVAAPWAADWALRSMQTKSRKAIAMRWAQRHPAYAAQAWIPQTLQTKGKVRARNEAALRHLAEEVGEDVVREAADRYGNPVRAEVDALLAEDPLVAMPKKPPKMTCALPAALPRPRIEGRGAVLPLEAVEVVVRVLAMSEPDAPYAGLQVVKDVVDADSLATFAWALFEQWLYSGAPSAERWALDALGHVGNDAVASKLTPLLRQWPGQSAHARAVMGLDVLLAIGTNMALLHLNGVAQRVKYKGIKKAAQERIAALAEQLELTQDELADRLVPDLDLDENGSLVLDFGPRTFTVGFDEGLKPFVRDEAGKPRKSLPKPGKKDDAETAGVAVARFKQLKKDVSTVAKIQVERLKKGMVAARRWSAADFDTYLVQHPLMVHLARRVVWGVYDASGTPIDSFRVAEDRTLADVEDEAFELASDAVVGVIHPADVSDGVLSAWGEVFADYEMVQPFRQLGRPVYRLTEEEKASTRLERHKGATAPAGKVIGMKNRGWVLGDPQDAGVVHWVDYPLADGTHVARILLGGSGLWMGGYDYQDEDPTLEGLVIVRREDWRDHESGQQTLGTLSDAMASELILTLEGLASA